MTHNSESENPNQALASMEGVSVIWDAAKNRFATSDGLAYVQYAMKTSSKGNQKIMDLLHTYVPPSKRGSGVAGRLCTAAFEHAKKNGFQVIPTCTYISDTFLIRNPTWKDTVYKHSGSQSNNE